MPPSPASSRPRLIAVILAKNEAAHIPACIHSLNHAGAHGWVDAVVVWDSGSTDATRRLAQAAGAHVVHRPFDNYARQRQSALDTLAADWILFVDADERIPPALAAEIQARLAHDAHEDADPPIDGYWIPRRNFIVGHEPQGGGFYPDYQLRLLRRSAAHYAPRAVHEVVEVHGETSRLAQPMLHYNYRSWGQFHRKQRFYARFEAQDLADRGVRPRPHNFVLQPLREFRRRYIALNGKRDGRRGLLLALLLAWYYGFMPYWYLMRRGVAPGVKRS